MAVISMLSVLSLAWAGAAGALQPAEAPARPGDAVIALVEQGRTGGDAFQAALAGLRAQAEAGDAEAMIVMGELADQGLAGGPDSAESWLRRAMEAEGSATRANAAYTLAGLFMRNGGAQGRARALLESIEDPPEALQAQIPGRLGADYLFGLDGDVREDLGRALLNSAIARGFRDPGILAAYGEALLQIDRQRAMDMMAMAAEAGSPRAAWRLAMAWLEEGSDPERAYRYVAWAADQGLVSAQISRAVMLATGQGVDVDLLAARTWYRAAAGQGSAHGLRGLAYMMISGEGAPPDPATGYALAEIAAQAGEPGAVQLLANMPAGLTLRPDDQAVAAAGQAWMKREGLSAEDFS